MKTMTLLGWVLAALLLLPGAYADEAAKTANADEDCPCGVAEEPSQYCGCGWVTITVPDETDVWWGNQQRSHGPYIRFAKAEIPEPPLVTFEPIYFDLDKSKLRPRGIQTAKEIVAYMKKHPQAYVRIEGNCCDLAPNDYNMKLGQRRAHSVARFLVKHGVDKDRIATATYGEERRVTTDPDKRPLNRRADAKGGPKEAVAPDK